MTGLHLVGGRVRLVHLPRGNQSLHHVAIDVAAFGLAVGTVRSADLGALVVVQAKPVQRVQKREIAFLAVTFGVGVYFVTAPLVIAYTVASNVPD
jgi:hypothetical protein